MNLICLNSLSAERSEPIWGARWFAREPLLVNGHLFGEILKDILLNIIRLSDIILRHVVGYRGVIIC